MKSILTINGGSSSIRFALFDVGDSLERRLSGKLDRIGQSNSTFTFRDHAGNQNGSRAITAPDHAAAIEFLVSWLEEHVSFNSLSAIGHRVVHGMLHTQPALITPELLEELRRIIPYDPDHLPQAIQLVEAFGKRYPALPAIACFDTAFHSGMPAVAKLLPIPRRFDALGVRRYGFHGLSYSFLIQELARVAGAEFSLGRAILAHLGNGASLAALRGGKSVDTSMGFTPTSGLPMGTRSGDLDPGVAWYLMDAGKLTPAEFSHLVNHESGLIGISETSSDMRDLLERQTSDPRAAQAVELFCYQTRKWIGAFAAVLGGCDTLVFSGGIGENAGEVRWRICSELKFLGIELDEARNAANNPLISSEASRVAVRVIPTEEETMIAREVARVLKEAHQ